jgi:hypothetical protein
MNSNKFAHIKIKNISSFGLGTVIYFIAITFVVRFLSPFGDEPDFEARSYGVLTDDHVWWSPYSLFHGWIEMWSRDNPCQIDAQPLSLWTSIPAYCGESLFQILSRFVLTVILMLPIFFVVIFRRASSAILRIKRKGITEGEWNLKLDGLALSILIPGVISAVGFMAEEQFVVILSLLLILVLNNIFLLLGLLYLIFTLDSGNGIVVFSAILFMWLNDFVANKISINMLKQFIITQLSFVMYFGFALIDFFPGFLIISEKVREIYNAFSDNADSFNNYPVILRPIITFMSALFMSPAGLKMFPIYAVATYFVSLIFLKLHRLKNKPQYSSYGFEQNESNEIFKRCIIQSLTALNVVLFFVFLLPTYSNAKYYLFLMPFFMIIILQVFSRSNVRKIFISFNLIVVFFLILYRVY